MKWSSWVRRAAAAALLTVAVAGVTTTGAPSGGVVSAQSGECGAFNFGSGGEFHSLTPTRIFDTRDRPVPLPIAKGKAPTSTSLADTSKAFGIQLLGEGGIPSNPDDVLAVVASVTVVEASGPGFLSIYPRGFDTANGSKLSSLVNFSGPVAVPNLAILGVGTGGALTAQVVTPGGLGSAHVFVDVFGWISKTAYADTDDDGARLVAIEPNRILDTRLTSRLAAKSSLAVPILGAKSINDGSTVVPNDENITAVMINLTAVNTLPLSGKTFVVATPTPLGGATPTTSNTNVDAGRIKANLAIVPVGPGGRIHLYNDNGFTDLVVDVLGYMKKGFGAESRDGRIIPLEAPFRAFDTREPEFSSQPLATGSIEEWSFQKFVDSVRLNGLCVGEQSALIGNLTVANMTPLPGFPSGRPSFLSVIPGDRELDQTSNVNFIDGESVPNMSLVKYGTIGNDDYVIKAYNDYGSLHYLLDVFAIVL